MRIKTAKDACSWFKQQGWILSGESYNCTKLACILLTVALSLPARIPDHTDTKNTITAIALLIEDNVTNCISSALAEAVATKTTTLLKPIANKLATSSTFVSASNTQQAKTTLTLKEASTNLTMVMESLDALSLKLANYKIPTAPPPPAPATGNQPTWASIIGSSPPMHLPAWPAPPPASLNPAVTVQQNCIQQCILCSAWTILIDINKDNNLASTDCTPAANNKLRETLNKELSKLKQKLVMLGYVSEEGKSLPNPDHKTHICAISSLECGGYLFEMDLVPSAYQF
ncbi:hypothetical protein DXG03_007473 [Asterophora parasitica]|uniref:Uncharacterized protein n=1 Tax=Asterophora parasitica TaxID=117018 RepID=A0A9P7K926_9AGAR|nr:hypothetical protein DXG03_007473 [Asterophora parasitica]